MNKNSRSVNESNEAILKLRQTLGQSNKEAQDIERQVNNITQRMIRVEAQVEASTAKIDLLNKHLMTLSTRKDEYETLIRSITERIEELKKVEQDTLTSSSETDRKITEYQKLKEQRTIEIQQAEDVAKRATSALVEIDTQQKIADDVGSEDKALALIEEMVKAGALVDVYGKISTLIKYKNEHAKAVEAAAAGWTKALVVKDVETAVACIEVLKKTRSRQSKDSSHPGHTTTRRGQTTNRNRRHPWSNHQLPHLRRTLQKRHQPHFWRHTPNLKPEIRFPRIPQRRQSRSFDGRPVRSGRSNGNRLLQTINRLHEPPAQRTNGE